MYLASCTERRGAGYLYLLTAGAFSHTAFTLRRHLLLWLAERGLKLPETLPCEHWVESEDGRIVKLWMPVEFQSQAVIGTYARRHWNSLERFEALKGSHTRVMSNARFTRGIVTVEEGVHVVNYMNVNHDRKEYDYAESRRLYG